jgi:hypothetical protein
VADFIVDRQQQEVFLSAKNFIFRRQKPLLLRPEPEDGCSQVATFLKIDFFGK